ncbi:MAG: hypothetical protein QW165_01200 [Candidatus Woesearchaeota archaeon]
MADSENIAALVEHGKTIDVSVAGVNDFIERFNLKSAPGWLLDTVKRTGYHLLNGASPVTKDGLLHNLYHLVLSHYEGKVPQEFQYEPLRRYWNL